MYRQPTIHDELRKPIVTQASSRNYEQILQQVSKPVCPRQKTTVDGHDDNDGEHDDDDKDDYDEKRACLSVVISK